MPVIDINLSKIKQANYEISPILAELDSIKRQLGILKWRIPEELLDKRDILKSILNMTADLEVIQNRIKEVNAVSESAVTQYMNTDSALTADIDRFE